MRIRSQIIALGVVLSLGAGTVHSGVYSTIEPRWSLNANYFGTFREKTLIPLRQVGTAQAELSWQKYTELAAAVMKVAKDPPQRGQADPLTPDARLNLATCLLRMREPAKAIPILNSVITADNSNFLAWSTLGTAFQINGDYLHANDCFGEASRYWGKPLDKLSASHRKYIDEVLRWSAEDFAWYATCEKYHRKLVKLRFRELKQGPMTTSKALERLDPIFEPDAPTPQVKPLKFVGESGKFEPGKLAAAEKAKLPPKAIEIVEQLLVWMPDDVRLYWLLGELLNAHGDVDSAQTVFKELLAKFAQANPVSALPTVDPKTAGAPKQDPMAMFRKQMDDYFPRFADKYPEVAGRLKALVNYVPPAEVIPDTPAQTKTDKNVQTDNPKPDAPEIAPLKLDWQTLGVGFGGGTLAGFLMAWRLRDLLKRRQVRG